MKIYIALLMAIMATSSYAQQSVTGTVSDTDGEHVIGATVAWKNSTVGTTTDVNGKFEIKSVKGSKELVVSFIGYEQVTVKVSSGTVPPLEIKLKPGIELKEVQVTGRKLGLIQSRAGILNSQTITSTELLRAACCNLGESFETNPSVDVSYSDAATGAKQIKLLGLSGTYVQMLTENIPNFRGAASPYGLGYIPGPWMQSIQVSKGTSSVKNGYEAITGQINVEYKKPQTADFVSANLYGNSMGRIEANSDASVLLNKNLSTMVFAHYENETMQRDDNHDGFNDSPTMEQYNLQNRWAYHNGNYMLQAGIKGLSEKRVSGQMSDVSNPYRIGINTDRVELFAKNAFILDPKKNSSIALILSGSVHNQDSYFGRKLYDVNQKNGYASLLFETDFTKKHNLSTGLSFNYDSYDQDYRLTHDVSLGKSSDFTEEAVSGAYAQYTYTPSEKWTLMAGLRGDYSSQYGFFVTPRAHVKYNMNEYVNFRLSAGKGYRNNHVLAENNYLLASSRNVNIADNLNQEEAWNYGASASFYLPIAGKTLNINTEYYYTNFVKQVVADMDTDPHAVSFYNLDGKSYAKNFQVEASYPFFKGFTLTAAYRMTDVKTTYNGILKEKPLTGKYKGLITASYQTPLKIWQFDTTLQFNGGGRMPSPYTNADGTPSWNERYKGYPQLNAQITRFFRLGSIYAGAENLTGFTQKNPIIAANDPYGPNFDSTMIWGPVQHGSKFYVGIRFNLPRMTE
ncbi:TonB-dependent receptor domain-containing protein [uncultured Bacteroides sp.]|uniref:TonB-dependent receptor plug domain-containing protein n=1 Tax=uncultured Bacteroides sp. TaxID=162156 RepID=UPI003749F849